MVPTEMDESAVWENMRRGSEQDFTLLYRKYAPVMFRYGCKLSKDRDLIKDCLQLVFFKLWKAKENTTNPASVKNYLLKALRNEVLKNYGSREPVETLPEEYHLSAIAPYESDLIDVQTAEDTRKKIAELMAKLPDRQREVIFLRYYGNLSYQEISVV
ncbi:MAG: sigma-70 family RNA polymerase sigma factor, partial [Ferruginibacter sp.]|nr:sigma-70 family RNA polymerase sigma factor [Cytophagales bacterium]